MKRQLLAVAVAAVSLLAGCSSPPEPITDVPPPPPPPAPFVLIEAMISNSTGGPEPSIGVAPDGTLYTNLRSNVFRSRDNGTTWEDLGNPFPGVPNNDPDLAVDVDGTVWESRLYAAVCSAVSVSRDAGETWDNHPAACAGPIHDRQYVIPTEKGTAYLYSHQLPSFQQMAVKTTDYGQTWLPTGPAEGTEPHFLLANGGSGWGGGGFWNRATGSVWFTFNYVSGTAGSGGAFAGYSVTHDEGATFTLGTAAQLDGRQLGLGLVTGAADDAGNVYLTWGEAVGDDVGIFVAASRDDGATWLPKVRIDDGEGSKVFPVLVAGAAGRVAVAYYESAEPGFPDQSEGPWNVTLTHTDDAFANKTWTHHTLTSTPVKEAPICISGTTCRGDREFADYFDAARMPDGRVAVTYNRMEGDELRNGFSLTSAALLGAWRGPAPPDA